MKRNWKGLILILIPCFFIVFFCGSVVKCEVLTFFRGSEFANGYLAAKMIDTPIRYKVLDYTDKYARVYYVDEISGDIVDFAKKNDKWEFDGWDTIWSNGGTADGVLWPYLWDSLKGKIRLVLLAIVMSVYILITIIILRGK